MTDPDYLVVGGGTAGCIVASRLSEDPTVGVTVIEAGPSDENEPRARSIRRWAEMLESDYDQDYRSVPQVRGNSGIRQARMHILGGCATANTMITWRPLRADTDEWVALGADGWDADTLGRCFDRLATPIGPVAEGDRNPYVADVVEAARTALDLPARENWNSDDDFARTGEGAGFFDYGYFTDPDGVDEAMLVAGIRAARRIAATAPMSEWVVREVFPGPDVTSDEELSAILRATHQTVYHVSGTCRMGADDDPMAVLDPQLRVRGVSGLRVVDASVFPTLTAVNPVGTIMSVAERAAELISADESAR